MHEPKHLKTERTSSGRVALRARLTLDAYWWRSPRRRSRGVADIGIHLLTWTALILDITSSLVALVSTFVEMLHTAHLGC
jgi:hypothetical protein